MIAWPKSSNSSIQSLLSSDKGDLLPLLFATPEYFSTKVKSELMEMKSVIKMMELDGIHRLFDVWFQKISIPPPRRELEIPKGRGGERGGQRPRKFQRGGGLYDRFSFQRSFDSIWVSKILSYLLSRTSHEKYSLEYLYLTRITFEMHFLSSKSTLEANKCEGRAVAWKWPPLLVTSPHGVTLWTEKQWRLA